MSILELYKSSSGFEGRTKTFLASSQTIVPESMLREVKNQPGHLNLKLLSVERLAGSGNQSLSATRQFLYRSLVGAVAMNSSSPNWYNNLFNKTGYKFKSHNSNTVSDASLKRIMESVRGLATLQLLPHLSDDGLAFTTPYQSLLNCSRSNVSTSLTALCFNRDRQISLLSDYKAVFALNQFQRGDQQAKVSVHLMLNTNSSSRP